MRLRVNETRPRTLNVLLAALAVAGVCGAPHAALANDGPGDDFWNESFGEGAGRYYEWDQGSNRWVRGAATATTLEAAAPREPTEAGATSGARMPATTGASRIETPSYRWEQPASAWRTRLTPDDPYPVYFYENAYTEWDTERVEPEVDMGHWVDEEINAPFREDNFDRKAFDEDRDEFSEQIRQTDGAFRWTAEGTIAGFHQATVRGRIHPNTLVLLKGADGPGTRVVDLGPKPFAERLNLTKGQMIRAAGPLRMIQGRSVLLAQEVVTDGQSVDVLRRGRPEGLLYHGEVEALSAERVRGRGTRQLARVQLGSGSSLLVDLGPARQEGLELAEGDAVTLWGVGTAVQDQPALRATAVRIHGDERGS